jgi:GGDEF domain-containing protein
LISILKTGSKMEHLERYKNVALECYGLAIASTEQNVIEVDQEQAALFRAELQALANQLSGEPTPEQLRNIQGRFQDDLRDYRSCAHEQIRQLRKEMEEALSALEGFAGDTAAHGDDHEKELKRALRSLEAAAFSGRFEEIRAAVRAISADILASFAKMRAQNQFAVAQLKDEIRLLHQRIQGGRSATASAPETWNRQDIDHRIDEMLKQNISFCLVLIVLKNLKALTNRYSSAAVEDALQALDVRLRETLGGASMLGRWTANQYVAILNVSPSSAMAASRDAAQKLAEPYSFTHNGAPSTLVFQVAAGVVDHQAGSDTLKFQPKLASLSAALGGGSR